MFLLNNWKGLNFPKKKMSTKEKEMTKTNSENGYSIFNWDAEYASIVKFYAQLALAPGWIEYTRDLVKQKQQTEPLFKNLGKDVAEKIKELKDEKSK